MVQLLRTSLQPSLWPGLWFLGGLLRKSVCLDFVLQPIVCDELRLGWWLQFLRKRVFLVRKLFPLRELFSLCHLFRVQCLLALHRRLSHRNLWNFLKCPSGR